MDHRPAIASLAPTLCALCGVSAPFDCERPGARAGPRPRPGGARRRAGTAVPGVRARRTRRPARAPPGPTSSRAWPRPRRSPSTCAPSIRRGRRCASPRCSPAPCPIATASGSTRSRCSSIDTVFDAFARAGRRVAIVAVARFEHRPDLPGPGAGLLLREVRPVGDREGTRARRGRPARPRRGVPPGVRRRHARARAHRIPGRCAAPATTSRRSRTSPPPSTRPGPGTRARSSSRPITARTPTPRPAEARTAPPPTRTWTSRTSGLFDPPPRLPTAEWTAGNRRETPRSYRMGRHEPETRCRLTRAAADAAGGRRSLPPCAATSTSRPASRGRP